MRMKHQAMLEQNLPYPKDVEDLGGRVARALRIGDTVCLYGPLGAGKTTLARGLIRALTAPDEEVPSPTFTLVQTYDGPSFAVAHFDLYRLARPEEAFELGLDEALEDGAAVIEWPERLGDALPANRLDIELSAPPEGGRVARLTGHGDWTTRMEDLLR